jgi:radical SAM family uncharacterized protein
MLDDSLLQVRRPAQYIGREWNSANKDFDTARIKFALCFPDLYEVGMSNLGIRILYGLLNRQPHIACERFFSPDIDLEKILRSENLSITSLESQRRLAGFDLIGVSLPSELCYTNVLNLLDLGFIPLKSAERDNRYPLVVGGGPCAVNPEPMHEFFDLFLVGEGEDAVLDIINIYDQNSAAYKESRLSKTGLLAKLSAIPGVYVPSLKGPQTKVRKRIVNDFDSSFFPKDWMVPFAQIIHDRITLEIMRGCPNRCRFCQARSQYYPLRIRKPDTVCDTAAEAYRLTGYDEISLAGLSVSDYPGIEELSSRLLALFKDKGVSLSLPSVKARSYVGNLSSIIAKVKKTGLTFAPEAGSQRLRESLAKDFNEEDFFKALREAYKSGYQHVKLYFMIGLPGENADDLEAIIRFSAKVSELRREVSGRPAEVNISINALIPKPHTAFQWFKMCCPDEIRAKQDYIKKINKNRRLRLNFHNRHIGYIEGILARGDRSLSRVILHAFRAGAKFDAWADRFSLSAWLEAFGACGITADDYLKEKSAQDALPWDFIDTGLNKEELLAEFEKIIAM